MNHVDGDDVFFVGFSHGAFTARSVADMITSVGLLNHNGLDHSYDIATDYQLMGDKTRKLEHYLFHDLTQYGGQKGRAKIEWEEERRRQYRE